jgi:hypothetical protein
MGAKGRHRYRAVVCGVLCAVALTLAACGIAGRCAAGLAADDIATSRIDGHVAR